MKIPETVNSFKKLNNYKQNCQILLKRFLYKALHFLFVAGTLKEKLLTIWLYNIVQMAYIGNQETKWKKKQIYNNIFVYRGIILF